MKKTLRMIVLCAFLLGLAAGCSGESEPVEGKTTVVTTFYPLYDFAQKIGGEHVHVTNLVPAGIDIHDWSPKARDLRNIRNADLFIYNGAGLEGWVGDILDTLGDNAPFALEASQGVHPITGEGDDEHGKDHREEAGVDPHTWLSPVSALVMAENIKDALIQADPVHEGEYSANYQRLKSELERLDELYRTKLSQAKRKTLVTTHHSFGYLCRDYGLTQVALMGLNPNAEPTAQTRKEVAETIRREGVKYIFLEKLVSDKVAQSLMEDLNIEGLPLHPLEGLTEEEIKAGADYISIMEQNLEQLVIGLN